MVEIPLPHYELAGGTTLLLVPTAETALLHADGSNRVNVGLGANCVTLHINPTRASYGNLIPDAMHLSEDEALSLVNAILSKLYYLKGVR